ncbi:hypothetical protein K440DRAFT_215588 [Wilcoxina mikolae CBS 423.85]|nr:hypothetical protein K440DRAFT_215588 [Wilcoxina mikolae CBS 423.85]
MIWAMVAVDFSFLVLRFRLRLRQKRSRPSDYLITIAFLLFLAEAVLITIMDAEELHFNATHPKFPRKLDPVGTPNMGYAVPKKITYVKELYAILLFNIFILYTVKATLLSFFYEVFPVHLRRILHLTSLIVAFAFLANFFSTIFWCYPHSRMWSPRMWNTPQYCAIKLRRDYNEAIFGAHLASTVIVVVLPTLLLTRIAWTKKEATFAISTLILGFCSVMASIVAFLTLLKMGKSPINRSARHAAVLASGADQNAIFWAACLSVLRLTRRNRSDAGGEGSQGKLVITVERRWSVQVDIVEEWGQDWNDPWQELRGRAQSMVSF